jgi:hypothetical protein
MVILGMKKEEGLFQDWAMEKVKAYPREKKCTDTFSQEM